MFARHSEILSFILKASEKWFGDSVEAAFIFLVVSEDSFERNLTANRNALYHIPVLLSSIQMVPVETPGFLTASHHNTELLFCSIPSL